MSNKKNTQQVDFSNPNADKIFSDTTNSVLVSHFKSHEKTAVEWLMNELAEKGLLVTKDIDNLVSYNQAKKMEQEQKNNISIFCQVGNIWTYVENGVVHIRPLEHLDTCDYINDGKGFGLCKRCGRTFDKHYR